MSPPPPPPSMAAHARAPYAAPRHPDGLQLHCARRITFRHPGYSDSYNIILVLPALDGAAGIHHETARVACAVCANNRWDGFFAATRTGPPVPDGPDDVLRAQEYYFRVSDDAQEKYPLVPSFAHWRFPHGRLPASWAQAAAAIVALPPTRPMPRQSGLTEALMARDISCRITAHVEGTEHAHLVPRNEAAWFEENAMFRYTDPVRPDINIINDPRNAVLLRSDVHTLFDHKRIALVPRSAPRPVFVVHVLAAGSSPELVDLYHGVALQPLHAVAIECLFARFAWTIFAYTTHFLAQGVPRVLTVVHDGEPRTLELPAARCKALAFPAPARSKSRSNSPQKRKRDDDSAAGDDSDDEPVRGRKRRRSFEVESSFDGSSDDRATPDTVVDDLDLCAPSDKRAAATRRKVAGARDRGDDGQHHAGAGADPAG